jgi:glucokinase
MAAEAQSRSGSEELPVLEIGGTHVLAGVVDTVHWTASGAARTPIDADGSADELLDAFAQALIAAHPAPSVRHVVAIPGPFDYGRGIGAFDGVAKFGTLREVDVRAGLRDRLPGSPELVFVNDATAAAIGEWHAAGRPSHRSAYLALGTGIGSAFLDGGHPVTEWPGLPKDGHLYLLDWRGRPIEDAVSRRAIRSNYRAAGGDEADVREIAERARAGDATAGAVLDDAFRALGQAIGPVVGAFGATEVVVGGSISQSFDLIAGPLEAGLRSSSPTGAATVRPARSEPASALIGAAIAAEV